MRRGKSSSSFTSVSVVVLPSSSVSVLVFSVRSLSVICVHNIEVNKVLEGSN